MAATTVRERTGALTEVPVPIGKLQIKNVLCPVDFSECSRQALRAAIGLARHFGSHLVLQHTAPPTFLPGGPEANVGMVDVDVLLRAARSEMRQMLIESKINTSEVTVLLGYGDVDTGILNTISKERIDLVVMGTHGHKGLGRVIVGSVTEDIIHQTACPVLVLGRTKKDLIDLDRGGRIGTILMATDFSAHSDRALASALKWGWEWGSRVVLFHAVEEPEQGMNGMVDLFPEYNSYFERQMAGAWEQICNLVPQKARQGFNIAYEVRRGNPKEEILRVAEERGAELIVTGAHGTGNSGAPWGSVSSAVARDGRYPVLVVPGLSTRSALRSQGLRALQKPEWSVL